MIQTHIEKFNKIIEQNRKKLIEKEPSKNVMIEHIKKR